jgi:hypothetical protein
VPRKLLEERSKWRRFVKRPTWAGSAPDNLFTEISKEVNWVKRPNSDGRGLDKVLEDKFKSVA